MILVEFHVVATGSKLNTSYSIFLTLEATLEVGFGLQIEPKCAVPGSI